MLGVTFNQSESKGFEVKESLIPTGFCEGKPGKSWSVFGHFFRDIFDTFWTFFGHLYFLKLTKKKLDCIVNIVLLFLEASVGVCWAYCSYSNATWLIVGIVIIIVSCYSSKTIVSTRAPEVPQGGVPPRSSWYLQWPVISTRKCNYVVLIMF